MMVPDFVIPLHLEDLEEAGTSCQLCVSDHLSLSELGPCLSKAASAEVDEGAMFIVDHFTTFYSLIKKFKQAPNHVREKGMKILLKAFDKLTLSLSGMLSETVDPDLQEKTCNVVKMIAYLLIELGKRFQDYYTELASLEIKGKGRKQAPKTDGLLDWNDEKSKIIVSIYNFLQLPIKLLWNPPIVDEEFINLFANFCYKCLEDPSVTGVTMRPFRSSIFQVLATLIKRHLHGLSFCVKVVQLLRMHEHLVNPLAQGVVEVVQAGCNNVVREIVREVGEADEQLLADAGGARCLSQFLTAVAEAAPSAVVSAVELLIAFLARDPPALRCCALTVLGEVVQAILTKENLEQELKDTRDVYLEALEEHIHDTNAFVRCRALQVWQKLSQAKAIPVARLHGLLELVIGRLGDKSSNVKKQAVQLVKVILEGNPYSGQLDVKEITTQLDKEKSKLEVLLITHKLDNVTLSQQDWVRIERELRKELEEGADASIAVEGLELGEAFVTIGNHLANNDIHNAVVVLNQLKLEFYAQLDLEGDDDVETSLQVLRKIWDQRKSSAEVPELSADVLERKDSLERGVAYLEAACEFAKLIDRALPLILTLLDSPAQTDVQEAISFFTAAFQFGFSRALEGVRRMLYLVFSKEAGIKASVCNAYKELYFATSATGRKQHMESVRNLSELVIQLNASQMDALEEVVREWIQTDVMDKLCIQAMFERFSMKIAGTTEAQSWAALALIAMVGAEQPKVIRTNASVLVSEGLGPRGARNFVLAQYTCRALQKLATEGNRLAPDDELLMRLRRLLREGLWSTQGYFVPFADEAISLVFQLAERPDVFAEELLVDLFTTLKEGKRPVVRQHRGRTLATNQDIDGDLFSGSGKARIVEEESEKNVSEESTVETDAGPEAVLLRLTRFISILGSVAAHYVGFLENRVLGEFKRRNLADFERKLKRADGKRDVSLLVEKEDLEFARVTADDLHAEEVRKIAEHQVVDGEGLLAKFLPLIQAICKQPGKFPSPPLQNAALLALGMFMQVSAKTCDQNLQLLVTVTEKSQLVDKRRNGLLLLWALQFRFPNALEPWTAHMFALLKDPEPSVRRTAVRVVTNLIVNEMVKARTHLADLATCLIDPDTVIAQTTRHFFREFAQKGNSLFNVLPTIVSSLTGPGSELGEDAFRTVMKFIMELVTKDKQQELLVEKLCQYFECATTDRQCRELAFCLSLLHYSEKALRKVLENFRCFGNKLYLAEVFEAFTAILTAAGRNPQKDKNLLVELQALVKEYREKSCIDRNIPVALPAKRCPPSTRKRVPRRRQVSSESEVEEEEVEKAPPIPRSTRKKPPPRKLVSSDSEADQPIKEEPHSDDDFVVKKKMPKRPGPVSDSDSGEKVRKQAKATRPGTAKKSRAKSQIVIQSDSDEETKRLTRSTRKRR